MKNTTFLNGLTMVALAGMMTALVLPPLWADGVLALLSGRVIPRGGNDAGSPGVQRPAGLACARAALDLLAFCGSRPRSRRKGPRGRDETEEDRRRLEEETAREIDQLAREFHDQLPRQQARSTGAIYARYSSRFQHSIADQVRSLFQAAVRENIFVPREHVFFDVAVRGCKERRTGLQALRTLLAGKRIQVLLVFTTNRLYRKTYKALQFVEEEVVERGIRCLFLKSGVDSADEKRWRMLLQLHAMTDEFVSGMYADNVRAAHEGLLHKKLVFGTITFGYRAREVPGAPTRRKRARCEYEIDPEAAGWVRKSFTWYVEEGLPIAEIIRRLNDDDSAPLGPKAVSGRWSRLAVGLLLSNPCYRGLWMYGKTKMVWQSRKDYSRQVPRDRPLGEQQFEELRIISDEQWYRAQKRLAEEPRGGGRRPKDGNRKTRPKLLNGFFYCAEHGRRLHVGGTQGLLMVCPVCQDLPAEQRPLYSQLNRVLALRLTCQKLAELIRPDPALIRDVIAACQQEAIRCQQPDPTRLAEARARHEKLGRQIQFVFENVGDSDDDRREAEETLRRLRSERAQAATDLARLEAETSRSVAIPTAQEVERLLARMGDILAGAGEATTPEDEGMTRQVVELLTGGRIDLVQQGERRAQRGWLRGRFRLRLLSQLVAQATGGPCGEGGDGTEVVIDYRTPTEAEVWADPVKHYYDEGMLIKAIASKLNINRNLARKALECWFERRGERPPDGRSLRASLDQKHLQRPRYQEIADEAKRLYDEGLLVGEIARRLQCDKNTLTKALAYWHTSRGLPVPGGRTRRKSLKKHGSRPSRGVDGESASPPS
jgi:hypothetical protein